VLNLAAGKTIEVAIADENPLVLSAISELLEKDGRFSLVLTANSAERFLESVGRLSVQVAIIGWGLPTLGGQRVLELIREQPDAPRILVYASSGDPDLPRKVMAAGGAGFCSRSEPPERLLETIWAVGSGQMVFPFLDVRQLRPDPLQGLTERERALLAALARGRTNDELAKDLGISINTVKFHLRNLYDKLSIRNRSQAIAFYYAATPAPSAEE
jgi:two-component system nitrate/nitrite response regulator NarP